MKESKQETKLKERIKELEEWIDRTGSNHYICTFHILKKVCSDCECSKKEKLNDHIQI